MTLILGIFRYTSLESLNFYNKHVSYLEEKNEHRTVAGVAHTDTDVHELPSREESTGVSGPLVPPMCSARL